MKTDDLIAQLASDNGHRTVAPDVALLLALASGALVAGAVFFLAFGVRLDLMAALQSWRFDYKLAVTVTVAVSAFLALRPLLSPQGRPAGWLLLLGPGLLALAVVAELALIPGAAWSMAAAGKNAMKCLTIVPALGLLPLALMILAIRQGAPSHPTWTGFTAGIAAGGLAATYYALNCTDDSPLFVATWYPLAILMLGGVGATAGRLAARW